MEPNIKPQFTVEQLYYLPFKSRRIYHEDGTTEYLPMLDTRVRTGVAAMDNFVEALQKIRSNTARNCAWKIDVRKKDLDGMVQMITGMTSRLFISKFVLMMSEDYLRYTNLTTRTVAKMCGYSSLSSFGRMIKKAHGMTPRALRLHLRQPNDLNRYRI